MEINLANHVGRTVVATQRDGSALVGLLTDGGPPTFHLQDPGKALSR